MDKQFALLVVLLLRNYSGCQSTQTLEQVFDLQENGCSTKTNSQKRERRTR